MKLFLQFTLILLGTVATPTAFAQKTIIDLYELYKGRNHLEPANREKSYADVAGSPYAQQDFVTGSVVLENGDTYEAVPLRYNAYEDQIEFKHPNGVVLNLNNPNKLKLIAIGQQQYTYFEKAETPPDGLTGYFELLENGEIQLLKRQNIILEKAAPAKAYQDPKPAHFKERPTDYYIHYQNQLFKVNSKKQFFTTFPSLEKELKPFIKKQKLKFRQEEDLRRIINQANRL